jgi:hypothetical protein
VDFEKIILTERSKSQRTTNCMTLFIWDVQHRNIHTEDRLVLAKGWKEGEVETIVNGYWLSYRNSENVK